MNEHDIVIASKAATTATYGGGTTAVFAGLTANEWGIVVGVIVGVAGVILQWYFGYEKLKLQRHLYSKIEHPSQEPDTGKQEL